MVPEFAITDPIMLYRNGGGHVHHKLHSSIHRLICESQTGYECCALLVVHGGCSGRIRELGPQSLNIRFEVT